MGGYPLAHAMMMMIPEAWAGNPLMDEDRRAFYEYHAALMEPWDGPAAMAFTDGRQIGATLDRNGLRPARFVVTDDDFIVMASEVGVLDIPERKIVKKWRLQPGKMLLVDLEAGTHRRRRGAEAHARHGEALPRVDRRAAGSRSRTCPSPRRPRRPRSRCSTASRRSATRRRTSRSSSRRWRRPARSRSARWATTPRCRCSPTGRRSFYNYFKQLFAQVTNPPIDPIREELVMSLVSFIGPRPNLLGVDDDEPPMRLEVAQPILTADNMEKLRHVELFTGGAFKAEELDICYPAAWGANGMEAALASLAAHAEDAIRQGRNILILSDRSVSAEQLPIPALLATAAVHEHLVKKGLRTSAGLVVETGSAREVHHFALLAGYGAEAIHPYLALETLASRRRNRCPSSTRRRRRSASSRRSARGSTR